MFVKWRSTKVSHSFSRVLLLAYLLSANPSSTTVVIPKECLYTDIFDAGCVNKNVLAKYT